MCIGYAVKVLHRTDFGRAQACIQLRIVQPEATSASAVLPMCASAPGFSLKGGDITRA